MAKDPVCGMFVEEGEHALQTTRYGTTYYFCSETCLIQFQAPEKALARLRRLVALGAVLTVPIPVLSWKLRCVKIKNRQHGLVDRPRNLGSLALQYRRNLRPGILSRKRDLFRNLRYHNHADSDRKSSRIHYQG